MPRLSSGLIIAGAYANKLRRTLFAQFRDKIKKERDKARKEELMREIARASGELNSTLFFLLRDLGVDKGDVVRIAIEYNVEEGKIKWLWDTLEVQHYKPVPETSENAKVKLKEILEKRAAAPAVPVELEVEYLGTVKEGLEDVYAVKIPREEELVTVGAVRVLYKDEIGEALAVIVTPEGRAYKYSMKLTYSPDPFRISATIRGELIKAFSENLLKEIDREKAKELLKELMKLK